MRGENGGKRVVVTTQSGDADPLRHVFDYAMGDWSLTRPSGVEERRERYVADERAAQVVHTTVSASGAVIERTERNYKWEPWGFAMTNRVDGFGGVTDTTEWTYHASGNGRGQVKTEKRQSGLLTQYAYDASDRVISETRSGPGMMTEATTYSYTPVDPSDPVLPVDTRPRTVVKTLDGVECERTYYVYSPLTNIVERAGTQGAPYGGTNALRTVTAFYPVTGGPPSSAAADGRIASVRHEDGRLDLYDYALVSNLWTETVTHLHEQSPSPVSGKTTRDITLTNARGEVAETRTEAYIDGAWHIVASERRTYNLEGKVVRRENLAGQVTTTEWDCCHKISETQPDGSTTTWDYDDEGLMTASSRLISLDMTNVTWLTTCYRHDALGRQIATWQTNYAAQVGLPATRASYDQLGRVASRIDALGNTTTTSYSPDGRTLSVHSPNGATRVITRNADGDTLSVTGSAVTPEFHTYGILPDGTRWSRTVQGETASSPCFTKRYENLLGQTIREERSGFQGALLATTHTYDSYGRLVRTSPDYEPTVEHSYDVLGNRIATTRIVGGAQSSATEWRRTSSYSSFILLDGAIWHTQTNIVSCSDSTIAPLATSSSRQLTGLTAAIPARTVDVDIRGNATETWLSADGSRRTNLQRVPYATNKPLSVSRYGFSVMDVSVSAVTNTYAYDSLGRLIAHTDGRGNTRRTEYNAFGLRSASIDALGNRTTYAYDRFGNLAAVTNALGNVIVYEYDLRGRKTYEGGATYPVRYTYDVFGNKTTMMTYRNESLGSGSGDVTTWLYDEASSCMTNKVYADGKGPTYSYTPDGRLSQRIWARGIVTDYSYDGWGNLTNTVYSDDTPTISLAYDALGRQMSAHDAAGRTTFLYDSFGSLTNETVTGVAGTNTIIRYWDDSGRNAGYALNAVRQSTIAYDPATARLAMIATGTNTQTLTTQTLTNCFAWSYLPGSDLKSSLAYPNGLTASWTYDANDQLLQVCNAAPTNVISQYDYTYDAIGRRIEIARSGSAMSESRTDAYGYNARNELISASRQGGAASVPATTEYAYQYDDIGNRITSTDLGTNRTYTANNLNQYTLVGRTVPSAPQGDVEEFSPQFDADGNQTLIQTSTGIWQVQYNGENRPTHWERISSNSSTPNSSTPTLISMSFDRMGRRVQYLETCGSVTNSNKAFTYDGYLQVANFDAATQNTQLFIWDPTEPIATRPLVFCNFDSTLLFYFHDGAKNVSGLINMEAASFINFIYSPCGENSQRYYSGLGFSSEYIDEILAIVIFNFRMYEATLGKWTTRDTSERFGGNLYSFNYNATKAGLFDYLGFASQRINGGASIQKQIINGHDDSNTFDGVVSKVSDNWMGITSGQELIKHLRDLSKKDTCISKYTIAGHGGRGPKPNSNEGRMLIEGIPGSYSDSDPGNRGIYLDGIYEFDRDRGGVGLSDLKKEIDQGNICFCDKCKIQIFACRIGHRFSLELSRITGCTVVAALGACSVKEGTIWQSRVGNEIERRLRKKGESFGFYAIRFLPNGDNEIRHPQGELYDSK
ncbi:MAG: RHS repeat protein [Kiritimatiellae bacterium]|nr:RHS repeat protein [Kiritimatiellia bacterium]